jgi:hypothetical protein
MSSKGNKKSRVGKSETAVLVFTTHGDIQVRSSRDPLLTEEVEKYRIPEGIEIVSLNAVKPSVPNMLPPKNVKPFIRIVRNATEDFNDETEKKEMKKMVKQIKQQIFELDDQPGEVAKEVYNKNVNYTDDEETMAYHHSSHEFLYSIRTYTNGYVSNKEFLREDKLLYKKNYEGETVKLESSNWKLNLLNTNVNNDEDLMDTLNPNVGKTRAAHEREEYTVTRLGNIIDELNRRGIKKVIIVDLTCSVIRKKLAGVTSRTERVIARDATPETPSPVKHETKCARRGGRINKTAKRYKK